MSAFVIGRGNEGDRVYAIELLKLRLGDASAAHALSRLRPSMSVPSSSRMMGLSSPLALISRASHLPNSLEVVAHANFLFAHPDSAKITAGVQNGVHLPDEATANTNLLFERRDVLFNRFRQILPAPRVYIGIVKICSSLRVNMNPSVINPEPASLIALAQSSGLLRSPPS